MAQPDQLNTLFHARLVRRFIFKDCQLQPGPVTKGGIVRMSLVVRFCKKLDTLETFDGRSVDRLVTL